MSYRDSIADALVGKTITAYELGDGGESITFHTTDGDVALVATGDCCSRSWIESLDAPDALLGTVTAADEIDMPDLGNIESIAFPQEWGVEEVSYYGLRITTERGQCVLDYRNDSNGYYGGSLEVA